MKRLVSVISIILATVILPVGCGSETPEDKGNVSEQQVMNEEIVGPDNTSEGTKVAISTETYKIFKNLNLGKSYEEIVSEVTELGMVEKEPLKEGVLETERAEYKLENDSENAYLTFEVSEGQVISMVYTVQMDIEDTGFRAERSLYDELVAKVEGGEVTTLEQLEDEIGQGYMIRREFKKFKDASSGEKFTYRWKDKGTYYVEVTTDENGEILGSLKGSIRKE